MTNCEEALAKNMETCKKCEHWSIKGSFMGMCDLFECKPKYLQTISGCGDCPLNKLERVSKRNQGVSVRSNPKDAINGQTNKELSYEP